MGGKDVTKSKGASASKNDAILFHNPYHFVPVKEVDDNSNWRKLPTDEKRRHSQKTFAKKLPERCRHDRYLSKDDDGGGEIYNGRIICKLETVTPIFVGGFKVNDGNKNQAAEVAPFKLDGKPAIPASTLRGMISSIAEAASNSSLRVLEKKRLSVRKKPEQALKELGIVKQVTENEFMVLPLKIKKRFSNNKDYHHKPLITYSDKNKQFYYMDLNSSSIKLKRAEDTTTEEKKTWTKGIVRYFPIKFGKKSRKHYFCSFNGQFDKSKMIPISKEAVKVFLEIANDRAQATKKDKNPLPYIPVGAERNLDTEKNKITVSLKTGDLIFFNRDGDTQEAIEISFSQIWRRDCGGTVHDYFKNINEELLPFNPDRTSISPAELVFGFVEDWKGRDKGETEEALAYKGRVRFSHGISKEEVTQLDPITLKILDSPKPPCPCLYFKHRDGSHHFIAKAALNITDHEPQGRKFYLHHNIKLEQDREVNGKKLAPWETHPELTKAKDKDSRLQQKTKIKPIDQGNTFWFHIDFENLNKYELGMLIYALEPSENFHHRIGMGKPLGLGTVKLETVGLFLIDRKNRYANDPFDDESKRHHKKFVKNERELENAPESYHKMIYYSYNEEFEVSELENIKKSFEDKIENDIKKALKLLGDPTQIKYPVHTPLCDYQKDQEAELKTFKWFVANEKKPAKKCGKQQLCPISQNNLSWLKRILEC